MSLTLYTPPVPRQKGVGRLGQYVHKAEESQSSACQEKYDEDETGNKIDARRQENTNKYSFYAVYSWCGEGKDTPDMAKIHSG